MSTDTNSMAVRIKRAWLVFRCHGGPITNKVLVPALNGQTARRTDVGIADEMPTLGWQCVYRLENCEACPQFKAYWQGVATCKNRAGNLHVLPGSSQVESDVGDGDRKAAEIEHVNDYQAGAIVILPAGHIYPNFDPVLAPVSPSIKEPKSRAKQGNAERNCLDKVLIHGSPKHSSGRTY